MIWIICWTIIGPIVLYHAFKLTWRSYILWTAQDAASQHRDLPIPPGDFGMPIVGETHLWALQVSWKHRSIVMPVACKCSTTMLTTEFWRQLSKPPTTFGVANDRKFCICVRNHLLNWILLIIPTAALFWVKTRFTWMFEIQQISPINLLSRVYTKSWDW